MSYIKNFISSVLLGGSYDKESKIMKVVFKNGTVYEYYNVPIEIWEEFYQLGTKAKDGSAGAYFVRNIKNKFRKE